MSPLEPVAIVDAARTPFCKAFTELADVSAVTLGTHAVRSVLDRAEVAADDIDEVVFGNVATPADAANPARVIALESGISQDRIAHTVSRNCGSGMESLITAWQQIATGRASTVIAGGTESMSQIPLLYRRDASKLLTKMARAKTIWQRLRTLSQFRPRHLRPVVGIELGLTDPFVNLNMGQTAEILADQFRVTREEQDAYAAASHQRAESARERCFLSGELAPFEVDAGVVSKDNGIRPGQSVEQLARLRPIFDGSGSVTAGNSCQLTDGAAAALLVGCEHPLARDHQPLGYLTAYAIAGCDPKRMGLGPVFATSKLLQQTGLELDDFDLIELNEAFAAQVIACQRAAESSAFARQELDRARPLGRFDHDRLNINGGAIALGHPVGSTGTRIVITLLRALRAAGKRRGLATLCIGGGQGMALMVNTQLEAIK